MALLQMQVESGRLEAENKETAEELATVTKEKAAAEEECVKLREDGSELRGMVDDLTAQLEVMTEERDCARNKEDELFETLQAKDEELMDTNNGYVYLTERLQEREEEMEEQTEHL